MDQSSTRQLQNVEAQVEKKKEKEKRLRSFHLLTGYLHLRIQSSQDPLRFVHSSVYSPLIATKAF